MLEIGALKTQAASNTKDTSKTEAKKNEDKQMSVKKKSSAPDKLSISSEGQQLARIMTRVSSGFYNTPEVLKETAIRIENELKSKE